MSVVEITPPLIAAIATPVGQSGGVGIVRVSGGKSELGHLATVLLGRCPDPRQAWYTSFFDAEKNIIDRGIALYFPAPHSFTGEHVLEFQAHGGAIVLELILRACLQNGARLAEPGEFTYRAFLNQKMDLAQAEAVADIISATTVQAARAAARSLTGVFSAHVHQLVERVTELRVLVEALIDFPDEELDFLTRYPIREPLEVLYVDCCAFVKKVHVGAWLQKGVSIVLLGAPNVGKSSLLNSLAGDDVAIVTPVAGTTRDPIRHSLHIRGIPIRLVDTAGVRSTEDVVELLGIERTWKEAQQADVVVLMQACDDSSTLAALQQCEAEIASHIPRLWVHNKVDAIGRQPVCEADEKERLHIYMSAKTRQGLELFEQAVLSVLNVELGNGEGLFIARQRHIEALDEAIAYFEEARAVWDGHAAYGESVPLELLAESLRAAQLALSRITGVFSADDLLGKIFGQFCIGK